MGVDVAHVCVCGYVCVLIWPMWLNVERDVRSVMVCGGTIWNAQNHSTHTRANIRTHTHATYTTLFVLFQFFNPNAFGPVQAGMMFSASSEAADDHVSVGTFH